MMISFLFDYAADHDDGEDDEDDAGRDNDKQSDVNIVRYNLTTKISSINNGSSITARVHIMTCKERKAQYLATPNKSLNIKLSPF